MLTNPVFKSLLRIDFTRMIYNGLAKNDFDSSLKFLAPTAIEKYNKRSAADTPRLTRQEPAAVRLGFVPDEWFTFFFSKTGVSGCGTFFFTFTTFLLTKEYYILEHNYYNGLSAALACIGAVKYVGPLMAEYLDKEIDEYADSWNSGRVDETKVLNDSIKNEEHVQWSNDGQLIMIAAKRENVALQLEAAYRQRLMDVYNTTKKRLDYYLAIEQAQREMARRNLVKWVIMEVEKAITDKLQEDVLSKCFTDLAQLAQIYHSQGNSPAPATT